MSPDERMRGSGEDVVVPFEDARLDPDLAALDRELRAAGDRLRRTHARDGRGRPSPTFAASLRARLLADVTAGEPAAVATDPWTTALAPIGAVTMADEASPARVRPRLGVRTPTVLPAPRWSILAIAAVFVASVLGLQYERLLSLPAPARVTDAAAASLVRDGARSPLAAGAVMQEGDVVEVARDGGASLQLGGSVVRVAGGGSLRVDDLTGGIALTQLDGRAWHRVVMGDGEPYTVTTDDLRWTAIGTAFDLSRDPIADGTEVRLLAVEHAVGLAGPSLQLRVEEGRAATVLTGTGAPGVSIGDVALDMARDPWLVANARLDLAAGFGVGWLTTALVDPTVAAPTTEAPGSVPPERPEAPAPSSAASTEPAGAAPDGSPAETVAPTPKPAATPRPSAKPTATPKPTPKPTATPKPTSPPIASLEVNAVACAGTAVLAWSRSKDGAFNHYTVLRGPEPFAVPRTYPPAAPVVGLEASYTTDPSKTTFADSSLGNGTSAWYRAVAWDADDRAIAATDDVKLTGTGVANLGPFEAAPVAGGFDATWSPYGGPGGCFTYYKVSWSSTNPNPSYLGDNEGAQPIDGKGTAASSIALGAGTWYTRIEAILVHGGKKILVGKSNVAQVTIEP